MIHYLINFLKILSFFKNRFYICIDIFIGSINYILFKILINIIIIIIVIIIIIAVHH
jgi:hypothetical protein